jgi:hydroxyethylthiazole kinase-like sugar kinase family protein
MSTLPNVLNGVTQIKDARLTKATLPSDCVGNSQIKSDAAIDAVKLVQRRTVVYAQNGNVDSAADRKVVHVARGAGSILRILAGQTTANGATTTVTVDVKKNNVSVLTSTIALTTQLAYEATEADITTDDYVGDDVLEVVVTVTGSNLGNGVFVTLDLEELPE